MKNCIDTDYYILHDNKCILSCNNIKNTIVKQNFKLINDGKKEYFYECAYACKGDLRYREETEIICNNITTIKNCEEFNPDKPYLIKDTKECITENDKSNYSCFYKECFNKCEDIKKYYDYEIVIDNVNKICNCQNLWKIVDGKKYVWKKIFQYVMKVMQTY